MTKYNISFDFTTVNKRSQFSGKQGEIAIISDHSLQQLQDNKEVLQEEIRQQVMAQHKLNVFMLTITDIKVSDNQNQQS